MEFKTHTGEPFKVATVTNGAGVSCRFCHRVVRLREKVAVFEHQPHEHRYECRDCLYAAPLTEHNTWRKDR